MGTFNISAFIKDFEKFFPEASGNQPWVVPRMLLDLLSEKIKTLSNDYTIRDNIAIHKKSQIEEHVIIKGPAIVSAGCFVGAHSYLRGGVFLGEKVSIGPGCEVKSTLILTGSALAHFNFAGDSLIGSGVNLEAGAVIANHYNERKDKKISIFMDGRVLETGVEKFGAVVGDHCKIGANAVLSPGTILQPHTIVKRLSLVEQCP